jgi:hypothetical protein
MNNEQKRAIGFDKFVDREGTHLRKSYTTPKLEKF